MTRQPNGRFGVSLPQRLESEMSFYTSIYNTPSDRSWVASEDDIYAIAALLRVTKFDSFSVLRETIPPHDPTVFDDERYEKIYRTGDVAIEKALVHHRAGVGYQTHMMFAFGDFMKELSDELTAAIPESISGGYVPWDTSVYNGRWSLISYEEGTITQSGAFAFVMHGGGCPSDWNLYLERFLAVEGMMKFKAQIETLTHQPFATFMELS